ncbi:sensor histidine kinase [Allorhizobium terrae]|uniref:histidine kinase n=1 Tax=Allorhizobium terrae TaxID=1848972 RepID=A0A4S3ZQ41_9HYPH|nr:HAMP domain-containing sensor histidine kinase [Allorhizobium terrae]THF47586.1 HAMP domain-containing histidine kinase [Allorhizobium terrae]
MLRKFRVQVLSKITDWAETFVDEAVTRKVARIVVSAEPSHAEIVATRRVIMTCLPALVLLPLGLSFLQGAAVALPLGFAIVFAIFLVALLASLRMVRPSPLNNQEETPHTPAPAMVDLGLFPGLALELDGQACVLRMGGRDVESFLPALRDPLGRTFIDQVHVTDRIAFVRAFDSLRQGDDRMRLSLRLGRPQADDMSDDVPGTLMAVSLDMAGSRDADGRLASVLVQVLDCTHEQDMAEQLVRLEADLQNAHEMKSRFLAAASHELRTPLNAILGFSDILMGDYFGRMEDERHREYVRLIRQSGGHLLSVVNSMLDMCRIEAGRYELLVEPFTLSETIHDCEKMLALQAREKGVRLTSRIGRNVGELHADPRAVRQILINLVGNAIKFTEAGGVITVDAARSEQNLLISVSDTGIGIEEDKIRTLGEPFVQVQSDYNRQYDGVGLGLSLVKGLVALHGGEFKISSRHGEGTLVEISLPIDGSGVSRIEATGESQHIEFPPRLQASMVNTGQQSENCSTFGAQEGPRKGLNGDAKAKIAG